MTDQCICDNSNVNSDGQMFQSVFIVVPIFYYPTIDELSKHEPLIGRTCLVGLVMVPASQM